MAISKTRISQTGFTLFEILIVLLIIAVMSGVATLQIGSTSNRTFIADANKMSNTFEILADEAVYTNSIIVCSVGNQNLSCSSYKDGEWSELNLHDLVSWGWPKNLEIKEIYVDDILLTNDQRIRFLPSGAIQPMSFKVTDGTYTAWIDGDMDGSFIVNK